MRAVVRKALGCSFGGALCAVIALPHLEPAFATAASATKPDAEACATLMGQRLGGATIDKTEFLAVGTPLSPFGQKAATEICRVSAHVSSGADSNIKLRVWMPAHWNGKLYGAGGGGFSGGLAIDGIVLTDPVNEGYAGITTDAGHDHSEEVVWALNHPQKIADFGNKANHLGAVAAKAIIAGYYRAPARRAYFHGCSNGGRDALMLAQRYPKDYDGIIAGAPANNWTALMSAFRRNEQIVRMSPGVDSLSPKLGLVHDAVMKQCDDLDGVKDGLIGNPKACHFDPAVLQCKAGAQSECLSTPEVAAFRGIYQGTRTSDGKIVMPGFSPGSEYQWKEWFTPPKAPAPAMGRDFYRYMVYSDPNWDATAFVLDRDYPVAKRRTSAMLDATNPDVRPFLRRGGRLLMYHGWDDAAIPPQNSISYFEEARRAAGSRADQMRLFMVPGMAHCGGGNGPNSLKPLKALETWIERGEAPQQLIATRYENELLGRLGKPTKVLRSYPTCSWPKTPHYKGSGAIEQADSYECR